MPKNNLPSFSLSDCLFCSNRLQILINKIEIDRIPLKDSIKGDYFTSQDGMTLNGFQ